MGEPGTEKITLFAQTNFRNKKVKFGIKTDDRRRHLYTIGKTGMGKSQLLENMMISDIRNGYGACMIDPHGDMVENIIKCVPRNRVDDIIYFNPADVDYPIAFNVFEKVDVKYRPLVASGVVGVFKKIWADSWGPRLEYILNNCILALLEAPDSTLLGVIRILTDRKYREQVLRHVTDPMIRYFWTKEFSKYPEKEIAMIISPIQNKVGQYLSNAMIRNIVGQPVSTINLRDIMDNKKVLLLNLSKGRVGEDASALLGALMITKIQLAAMSRVDIPEKEREDFYLYVDELQNFATDSFAGILSEARKYHLNLTMAHQYIEQLPETLQAAVFGNVGTMISFRVGATDAEYLAKEFAPTFIEEDFVNLPKFHIYLKLMIDGVASQGFSANTLPPIAKPEGFESLVIDNSRKLYSRPIASVEQELLEWWNLNDQPMVSAEEKPVVAKESSETEEEEVHLADMSETVKDQVSRMIKQSQNEREERHQGVVSKIESKKSENIPEVKISVSVKNETLPEKKMAVAIEQNKVSAEMETEKPRVIKTVVFEDPKTSAGEEDGKFNYDAVDWYNIEKKSKEVSFDGKYVCDVCSADMFLDFAPRLDKPILCQKCVKKRDKFMKRLKREKEEARALDAAEKAADRRLSQVMNNSPKTPARAYERRDVPENREQRPEHREQRSDNRSAGKPKGSNWGMMKTTASHQQGKQSAAGAPPAQTFRAEPSCRPPQTVTQNVRPPRVDEDFDDDLKKLYGADEKRPMPAPRPHKKPDLPPATIRVVGRPPVKAASVPEQKVSHEHLHYHVHTNLPADQVKLEGVEMEKELRSGDKLAMTGKTDMKDANAAKPVTTKAAGSAPTPPVPKPTFNPFGDDDNPPSKSGLKDLAPGEEVSFSKDDK